MIVSLFGFVCRITVLPRHSSFRTLTKGSTLHYMLSCFMAVGRILDSLRVSELKSSQNRPRKSSQSKMLTVSLLIDSFFVTLSTFFSPIQTFLAIFSSRICFWLFCFETSSEISNFHFIILF